MHNLSYLSLTVHFIDSDWKLQRKITNFCLIPDQGGKTIGREVESCLLDWGIGRIGRIFTVTVGNAFTYDAAIDHLKKYRWLDGKFLRTRCCAHLLNPIMNEGYKDFDDSITKIRNAVRYVRSSLERMKVFKTCVEMEGIKCSKLVCLDDPTKWNSTFSMLEAAEKLEKAFLRLQYDKYDFRHYFHDGNLDPPLHDDREKVRAFPKYLKLFFDATMKIYGSGYVTSNVYFQELWTVYMHLLEMSQSDNHLLRGVAMTMKSNNEKYWETVEESNLLIFVAVVLDPRCKLVVLQVLFQQIYDITRADEMLANTKLLLMQLYEEYNGLYRNADIIQPHIEPLPCSYDTRSSDTTHVDIFWTAYERLLKEANIENKSEFEQYLLDSCEPRNPCFNILDWWKINEAKYPILSRVARDAHFYPLF